mmetsp:Transcript_21475/g.30079  ORF Transcript_21475/g.30079 Transcript_21475/m.30079 type:complete len:97 (+) Transcript_21475:308-598(+)
MWNQRDANLSILQRRGKSERVQWSIRIKVESIHPRPFVVPCLISVWFVLTFYVPFKLLWKAFEAYANIPKAPCVSLHLKQVQKSTSINHLLLSIYH